MDIEQRFEKLERQNRRLKAVLCALGLLVGAGLLAGQSESQAPAQPVWQLSCNETGSRVINQVTGEVYILITNDTIASLERGESKAGGLAFLKIASPARIYTPPPAMPSQQRVPAYRRQR